MRIPMTTIQAASSAALPSQAVRSAAASTGSDSAANARALDALTEKTSESQQAGDRDAQEQYIATDPNGRKKSPEEEAPKESKENPASSIWSLAVEDETPRSDLDIRG